MPSAPHRLRESFWSLDPSLIFLNHGSFGACPRAVLAEQSRLRAELEREPVLFLGRELEGRMDRARAVLAAFVGAEARDLVFVANATAGVNAVLRSLPLSSRDELLVSDHEYNACRNVIDFVAARAGAVVRVARIPFPIGGPEEWLESFLAAAGPRTRLALFDHVSSQTALVAPAARACAELRARGILSLVDGAHGPGMLPLELRGLGADFYTGNCHKWLCGPKSAALLWARPEHQDWLRPTCVSHGANSPRRDRSRFLLEFGWTGTADPTPALCVPRAIEELGALLPGGWPELMRRNHELALRGREILCAALGIPPPAPAEMIGSMASIPLPPGAPPPPLDAPWHDPLQESLFREDRIEVPIMPWPAPPQRLLRISAQLYNAPEDYEALATALRARLPR